MMIIGVLKSEIFEKNFLSSKFDFTRQSSMDSKVSMPFYRFFDELMVDDFLFMEKFLK